MLQQAEQCGATKVAWVAVLGIETEKASEVKIRSIISLLNNLIEKTSLSLILKSAFPWMIIENYHLLKYHKCAATGSSSVGSSRASLKF